MITDKKKLPEIHHYTYDGDLSKKWFIYWYEDGKRIRKYKGINTHHSVKSRMAAIKNLKAHYRVTLSERVNGFKWTTYQKQFKAIQYHLRKITPHLSVRTAQQYKSHIENFLKWNQRRQITPSRIEDFFTAQAIEGLSQVTIHNYFTTFRAVFKKALKEDVLDGVEVKRGNSTPAQFFSKSQVSFLAKEISENDPELWLAIQLIYYCFIRPNELRQLRVGDIILEDEKICIPKEISKNRKTQYIKIPAAFMDDLSKAVLGKNPALCLIGEKKKPLGRNTLTSRHRKILKELNFNTQRFKLYSWKHTRAKAAVDSGIHIKQLQLQLRHHSLDQVNAYLRQMGVFDMGDFSSKMPGI